MSAHLPKSFMQSSSFMEAVEPPNEQLLALFVAIKNHSLVDCKSILDKPKSFGFDLNKDFPREAARYADNYKEVEHTPLTLACYCHSSIEIIKLLMEHGAQFANPKYKGLYRLANVFEYCIRINGNSKIAEFFLHYADTHPSLENLKQFGSANRWCESIDIESTNDYVDIINKDPEFASNRDTLLKLAGSVLKKYKLASDPDNQALVAAIWNGHTAAIEDHIDDGKPIPTYLGDSCYSLLYHAYSASIDETDKIKILHLLLKAGFNVDAKMTEDEQHILHHPLICKVVSDNQSEILKILIQYNCNVNYETDNYFDSPLQVAINKNAFECVQLLIKAKANLLFRSPHTGLTPLMHACGFGRPKIAQCLIDALVAAGEKDKINEQTDSQETAFNSAIRNIEDPETHKGKIECIEILLKNGVIIRSPKEEISVTHKNSVLGKEEERLLAYFIKFLKLIETPAALTLQNISAIFNFIVTIITKFKIKSEIYDDLTFESSTIKGWYNGDKDRFLEVNAIFPSKKAKKITLTNVNILNILSEIVKTSTELEADTSTWIQIYQNLIWKNVPQRLMFEKREKLRAEKFLKSEDELKMKAKLDSLRTDISFLFKEKEKSITKTALKLRKDELIKKKEEIEQTIEKCKDLYSHGTYKIDAAKNFDRKIKGFKSSNAERLNSLKKIGLTILGGYNNALLKKIEIEREFEIESTKLKAAYLNCRLALFSKNKIDKHEKYKKFNETLKHANTIDTKLQNLLQDYRNACDELLKDELDCISTAVNKQFDELSDNIKMPIMESAELKESVEPKVQQTDEEQKINSDIKVLEENLQKIEDARKLKEDEMNKKKEERERKQKERKAKWEANRQFERDEKDKKYKLREAKRQQAILELQAEAEWDRLRQKINTSLASLRQLLDNPPIQKAKEITESKEHQELKEQLESKEVRELKEVKEVKEVKELKEAQDCPEIELIKQMYTDALLLICAQLMDTLKGKQLNCNTIIPRNIASHFRNCIYKANTLFVEFEFNAVKQMAQNIYRYLSRYIIQDLIPTDNDRKRVIEEINSPLFTLIMAHQFEEPDLKVCREQMETRKSELQQRQKLQKGMKLKTDAIKMCFWAGQGLSIARLGSYWSFYSNHFYNQVDWDEYDNYKRMCERYRKMANDLRHNGNMGPTAETPKKENPPEPIIFSEQPDLSDGNENGKQEKLESKKSTSILSQLTRS